MAATALLFDLDGTLWDSRPWIENVLVDAHGAHRATVARRLAADCSPITLANELAIGRAALVRSCAKRARDLSLYPGVRSTLSTLATRRMPMAVVTSLAGDIARAVLDGHDLADFFEVVVTPTRGMRGKPHPDSLLRALDALQRRADGSIYYVGDKDSDATAANAAGVSFAWAAYGYGGAEPRHTDTVIRRFAEILEL